LLFCFNVWIPPIVNHEFLLRLFFNWPHFICFVAEAMICHNSYSFSSDFQFLRLWSRLLCFDFCGKSGIGSEIRQKWVKKREKKCIFRNITKQFCIRCYYIVDNISWREIWFKKSIWKTLNWDDLPPTKNGRITKYEL
jgi:hypothetical protein